MENNKLAVQNIPNHHENDVCKWVSCTRFPDQQEINPPGVHKYRSLAMCAKVDGGVEVDVAGGTRASRVRAEVSLLELMDPGDMPHQIFVARTLGLGGKGGEGRCKICDNYHASGVCKTCSEGLGSDKPKLFWLCIPGAHGRQCYCRHLHDSRVAGPAPM
jgi:hypothetical protein